MASLWIPANNCYTIHPIAVASDQSATPFGLSAQAAKDSDFLVVPYRNGAGWQFVLIDRTRSLLVNGQRVAEGIRVLHHKDEVQAGAQRIYFSTESQPVVETFQLETGEGPASQPPRRPRCAVCRQSIEDGQLVVRCPGCNRAYHQIEAAEKLCWSYMPECRFCGHPTSMSGEGAWHPQQESAHSV